jgi:UDP-N-acetyl-D-mannosaminuronate dehydrogenase
MSSSFKHICVIGLGYIGLPTAATFAAHGLKVTGVDINQHAIDMINQVRFILLNLILMHWFEMWWLKEIICTINAN